MLAAAKSFLLCEICEFDLFFMNAKEILLNSIQFMFITVFINSRFGLKTTKLQTNAVDFRK